jgi:hypothetical protein
MIKLLSHYKCLENKIIFTKIEEILNEEFSLKRNNSFESFFKNTCEDSRIMDQDTRTNTDVDKYEDKITLNSTRQRKDSVKRISRVSFKIMRSMEGNKDQKLIITRYNKIHSAMTSR